jgi:hypothetical protein
MHTSHHMFWTKKAVPSQWAARSSAMSFQPQVPVGNDANREPSATTTTQPTRSRDTELPLRDPARRLEPARLGGAAGIVGALIAALLWAKGMPRRSRPAVT